MGKSDDKNVSEINTAIHTSVCDNIIIAFDAFGTRWRILFFPNQSINELQCWIAVSYL